MLAIPVTQKIVPFVQDALGFCEAVFLQSLVNDCGVSRHMFRFFSVDVPRSKIQRRFVIHAVLQEAVKKLLAGVPDMVATPEIRVDCPDEKKFGVVEKVKDELAKGHPIIGIDGVRVQYPEGWGLVRASNTQPALVLRFEAKDEKSLEKIRADVEDKLKRLM